MRERMWITDFLLRQDGYPECCCICVSAQTAADAMEVAEMMLAERFGPGNSYICGIGLAANEDRENGDFFPSTIGMEPEDVEELCRDLGWVTREWDVRDSDHIFFDHRFETGSGRTELCHHTDREVYLHGSWVGEYSDSTGGLHYGN